MKKTLMTTLTAVLLAATAGAASWSTLVKITAS